MLATSPNLEDGNDIRYYYQRQEQEGHQITCPLDREALERNKVSSTTTLIGTSLRYQYCDGNEDIKRVKGLDQLNNNFACASHFFVHIFAVIVRL